MTASPSEHPATPSRPALGPLRVLLVDDHAIVRDGFARLLQEKADMDVVGQAASGQEALERVAELQPDVVVMDVAMPGMNGIEATRLIRHRWPDIRVVGLSMHESGDNGRRMREAGAEAYLTKGGDTDALLAAIRGAK